MLTGRNPLQAITIREVFALVLHGDRPPMGVGRDVELVVRRGLAKSNRERFPAITAFSEALRAAAAGRLRDSQRAATLAYAAGEVASHDSKERLGRRARGVALTLSAAASMTVAFVLGTEWNRRASFVGAAGQGRAGTVERVHPGQARNTGEAESSAAAENAEEPGDEVVVAPQRLPATVRKARPPHVSRLPVRADPHPFASEDEDATLARPSRRIDGGDDGSHEWTFERWKPSSNNGASSWSRRPTAFAPTGSWTIASRLDNLSDKYAAAEARLTELKIAGTHRWDAYKGDVENAWTELATAFTRLSN